MALFVSILYKHFAFMNKILRYLISALSLYMCLICTSCISKQHISSNCVLMEESLNDELSLTAKQCRYVKLDSSKEECIIKHAERVLVSKDMIYIIDRSKNVIMAYDSNGNFVSSTKHYIGRAKNEYMTILDATYDAENDEIYAYADNPSQIMIFDKSLSLHEVVPTGQLIREIAVDNNHVYTLFYDITDYNDVKVELRSYDKGQWSDYNVLLEQNNILNGVGCIGKFMTSNNDCCCLSMPFDNHIYILKNGQIEEAWEIDFDGKWFDFASSKDIDPRAFENRNKGKVRCITNICCTDSILMFNTNMYKYYLVSKSTLKGRIYSDMHISDVAFSTPVFTPACGSKGLFIEMVNPARIIDYVKTYEEKGLVFPNEEMRNLYKSFSLDDNPMLIICDF